MIPGARLSREDRAFAALLLLFLAYGAAQIAAFSFIHEGVRTFLLADDQMISMAYAKNLIQGNGLVWFKGAERVEGFSNPLWVFILAGLQLIPAGAPRASLVVQLFCLLLLAVNLGLVRRLAARLLGAESLWTGVAVLLVAAYYPLDYWCLSGFEVALLAPLLCLAVLWQRDELTAGRYRNRALLLLAAATLVRLDMLVPLLALVAHRALFRRAGWGRSALQGLAALALALSLQTLLRYLYYGDILPNTYYLKMTGYPALLRMARGALVLWSFLIRSWGVLLLLPLALLGRERRAELSLLLLPLAGLCLYSIYVGGDSWEFFGLCNRFIVVAMPLGLIVLAFLARALVERGAADAPRSSPGRAALALLVLVPALDWTGRAGGYRWVLAQQRPDQAKIEAQYEDTVLAGRLTDPGATLAVVWAGTAPFFLERRFIDLLGKNDRAIARAPMLRFDPQRPDLFAFNNPERTEAGFFYPGHLKWDYQRSIEELKPDLVFQPWGPERPALPHLRAYEPVTTPRGTLLFLRRDSPWLDRAALGRR